MSPGERRRCRQRPWVRGDTREDPETVFILGVLSDFPTNLEEFLGFIEHHHQIDLGVPDYVQGFRDAAELALKLCDPRPK